MFLSLQTKGFWPMKFSKSQFPLPQSMPPPKPVVRIKQTSVASELCEYEVNFVVMYQPKALIS